jgi:hypothetical protein
VLLQNDGLARTRSREGLMSGLRQLLQSMLHVSTRLLDRAMGLELRPEELAALDAAARRRRH